MKAIVIDITHADKVSNMIFNLTLPEDEPERQTLEHDFRMNMSQIGSLFIKALDKGTGRNSISYRCSSNTVAFNVGLDLRVKGKRVLGQRDLMHFVKTYCNAMSYSWVLEGKVHAPDATKRANAKSWLLSIQQTHDTNKRCGWLCQLVRWFQRKHYI